VRDDSVLGDDVVLGVFTELKNTILRDGVRVRHHSYLGDATIGENVNIGAGSITANYDGVNISKTTIGANSFIGAGSVLIAPLTMQNHSHVAPGRVVRQQDIDEQPKDGEKTQQ
jgi:bifunctional UDP-N-acetylglucosamine pyrophosphorylase/glucosamine-1-phosphate N-acetyltransferase